MTGNTGIDALQWAADRDTPYSDPRFEALMETDGPVIVATVHRRENWGGGLSRVAEALKKIAFLKPDARIVLPMHPNPLVREEAEPILGAVSNVALRK